MQSDKAGHGEECGPNNKRVFFHTMEHIHSQTLSGTNTLDKTILHWPWTETFTSTSVRCYHLGFHGGRGWIWSTLCCRARQHTQCKSLLMSSIYEHTAFITRNRSLSWVFFLKIHILQLLSRLFNPQCKLNHWQNLYSFCCNNKSSNIVNSINGYCRKFLFQGHFFKELIQISLMTSNILA